MKFALTCLLAMVLTGGIATSAVAQNIGVVNMERVLVESDQGKAVEKELAERFGDKQQEFAQREAEIRQLQAALERDKPLMSKAQVDKKDSEIKDMIEQFEKDFEAVQKEVVKAQQAEGQKILEPAQKAVTAVAKEQKLGAVFEASRAGLLYLGESADITDAVIKRMNSQ